MPPAKESPGWTAKRVYLLAYNATCALLWLRILLSIISILLSQTDTANPNPSIPILVYTTVEPWARWTQTLAVAEILHAATGLTRSPVHTTFTQVFARSVQVWAINYGYPDVMASSLPVYTAMLVAWSTADVIRYLYFVIMSAGLLIPGWLKWLRYSLFVILYPIGIGGEWWLMFGAARAASTGLLLECVWYFCLALYGPGSVMMYGYMLKQRRKTLARA
ncbi:putative membrane protein [Aspergillus candidus]|uniref:Very-long-chain (3R)-3-hydroxyacyl-CoA dehydratase n=1 Tax=Aspergillus candidus TaxID=41067 RepID=A0A2I2FJR6_ASPCN|nr:PTPLA-domain-containing protein [Aspergillus candidus]PLB40863.1 PTPLA-domain-containing protein [Aspergillus candidus]